MIEQPLVSVGIPTLNRPNGLRRTLECITNQTYSNLEIIISDNCSPTDETKKVVKEFMLNDNRLHYYKQSENKGPFFNFQFVLEKATGEYFMWAADDDEWSPNFIELCMTQILSLGENFVAVITEARYFSDKGFHDFFPEGKSFYNSCITDAESRLKFMLDHNYGDLYYSLFRKEVLFENGKSFFEIFNLVSQNEIPLFMFVSTKGNFRVLPDVGLYKRTNDNTYSQARWEMEGGWLPNFTGIGYLKNLPKILYYHKLALQDIKRIISKLNISAKAKARVYKHAQINLFKHFLYFIIRFKSIKK